MRQNKFLIACCCVVTLSWGFISCTYDYFEDETNYMVFVPEVLAGSISSCRLMVYNEAGVLVKICNGSSPWHEDIRMAAGQFVFRLPVGRYTVYCYTNTDSLSFRGSELLEESCFTLQENRFGLPGYVQPPDLCFKRLNRSIIHPGVRYVDTLQTKRYVGRVTIRFKHFPVNISRIKQVQLIAADVATRQYLKLDTLPTRLAVSDVISHLDDLPPQPDPNCVELEHRYFPSIINACMRLTLNFLDASGALVVTIPVAVTDKQAGTPLRLLHGKRLIIEIDSYTVVKISVVGWDEDIQHGDTDME